MKPLTIEESVDYWCREGYAATAFSGQRITRPTFALTEGKAWFWPSSDDIEVWIRFQFEVGGKSGAEVLRKDLAGVKKQN